MKATQHFEFLPEVPPRADAVVDESLDSKLALLQHLAAALSFPDYFGENWDALIDCLSDLEWVEAPELVVAHAGLPSLPAEALKTYLECLGDAAERRAPDDAPRLRLVFREADRQAVAAALAP